MNSIIGNWKGTRTRLKGRERSETQKKSIPTEKLQKTGNKDSKKTGFFFQLNRYAINPHSMIARG